MTSTTKLLDALSWANNQLAWASVGIDDKAKCHIRVLTDFACETLKKQEGLKTETRLTTTDPRAACLGIDVKMHTLKDAIMSMASRMPPGLADHFVRLLTDFYESCFHTHIALPLCVAKSILNRMWVTSEPPESCPECGEYRAPGDTIQTHYLHCAGCTIGQLEEAILKAEFDGASR